MAFEKIRNLDKYVTDKSLLANNRAVQEIALLGPFVDWFNGLGNPDGSAAISADAKAEIVALLTALAADINGLT